MTKETRTFMETEDFESWFAQASVVSKHQEHDQSSHGSWANGEPTSPITEEEKSVLTDYIKKGYLFVNGFLRKRESMGAEDVKIQEEKQSGKIAMIDSMFEKAPALDSDTILYRGLSGVIADKLKDAPIGSTFVDKGFVSTTEMIEIAKDFTSVGGSTKRAVLSITVPSGTKAMKVSRFLKDEPRAALELETILPRGLKFEITGRDGDTIEVKVVPNE
jgi:hypothetical protein